MEKQMEKNKMPELLSAALFLLLSAVLSEQFYMRVGCLLVGIFTILNIKKQAIALKIVSMALLVSFALSQMIDDIFYVTYIEEGWRGVALYSRYDYDNLVAYYWYDAVTSVVIFNACILFGVGKITKKKVFAFIGAGILMIALVFNILAQIEYWKYYNAEYNYHLIKQFIIDSALPYIYKNLFNYIVFASAFIFGVIQPKINKVKQVNIEEVKF